MAYIDSPWGYAAVTMDNPVHADSAWGYSSVAVENPATSNTDSAWGYGTVILEAPTVGASDSAWGYASIEVAPAGRPTLMLAGSETEVAWSVMKAGVETPVTQWGVCQSGTEVPLAYRSPVWEPPPAEVAGAAPLGSINYPTPTGSLAYMSPSGSDSAAGTLVAPKATLTGALAAISSGGTIVARGGVYTHGYGESVVTKAHTLQPYPGETVWFDGSDVITGWTYDSGAALWWATSTTEWDHSDPSGIAGALNPLAMWKDLLFRDGNRLFQVSYPPAPGQFSVDYDTNRVWIKDSPSGVEMRITTRARFLLAQGPDTTLRGIGVRRFTTPAWGGAIQFVDAAKRARVENCHLYDISSLAIDTDNAVVTRNTLMQGNTIGLGGNLGSDCEWSNNLVVGANQKLLKNHVPSAMKITKHTRPIIKHNIMRDTKYGMGIWLDVSCYQPQIFGNWIGNSAGNATSNGNGIFVELTEGGFVANNYCYGVGTSDARYALCAYNSGGVRYWNNYVQGFSQGQVFMGGDSRRNSSQSEQVNGDGISWTQIPWYGHDIEIVNNVLGENAQYFQFLLGADGLTAQDMVTRLEGNLSTGRPVGGTAHDGLLGWTRVAGTARTNYTTFTAANSDYPGLGLNRNSVSTSNPPPVSEWAVKATAIGCAIPDDIAEALGVPADYVAVGPILPAPVAAT